MNKFDINVWDYGSGSLRFKLGDQQTTITLTSEEQEQFQQLAENIWRARQSEIAAATVPPALADFSEPAPVPNSDSEGTF